jgi:glycosyltransferase involved in cell wall biosynthesis
MKEIRRVLYVAPRFHTNQVFPIKSLIRNGVKVKFISQYSHKTENYEDIKPIIMGYSIIFTILLKTVFWLDDTKKAYYQRKFGFPPLTKIIKELVKFNPDFIIIRDRTIYSLVCSMIARIFNMKFIIYTQTPKYTYRSNILREKIKFKVFGKYELTPIIGDKVEDKEYFNEDNIFYVPLIIDLNQYQVNTPFIDNCVKNLLIVSEFVERKKIIETLIIIHRLIDQGYKIKLSIIGNAKKDQSKIYLQKVKDFIEKKNLKDNIQIKTDIPHQEVMKEYLKSDIFLFPSTKEAAGYSLLEAMSSGIAVICSTGNGLKEYVAHNQGGFIFQDNNFEQLYKYIKTLLDNPELINQFGEKNLSLIRTKYNSQNYFSEINRIWNEI